jgi:agmatinase
MIYTLDIPFDEYSSFMRGSAAAPPVIHKAFHSSSSNYFTEGRQDLKDHDFLKSAPALMLSSGETALQEIETAVSKLLSNNNQVISLGGDHAITYPILKAFSKRYAELTILHIDAHSDLYDSFEGLRYSHACPFARVMEEGLATRLVQVGIRTLNKHQREQAEKFGVEVIEMKNYDPTQVFEFEGPVYISLDMDAIDPAFAPGVAHHEPGGFTSREVISMLQRMKASVVGADIVEFNPGRDVGGITAMLAAKLYKELIDLMLRADHEME